MTRLLAAVAVLFLTGPAYGVAPCASAASETDITGEVRRGMAFAASLGGGLVFRLVPVRHGWTVWIGDPAYPGLISCGDKFHWNLAFVPMSAWGQKRKSGEGRVNVRSWG